MNKRPPSAPNKAAPGAAGTAAPRATPLITGPFAALRIGYLFIGQSVANLVERRLDIKWQAAGTATGIALASLVWLLFQFYLWTSLLGACYSLLLWVGCALVLPHAIGITVAESSGMQALDEEQKLVKNWLDQLAGSDARRVCFTFKPLNVPRSFILQFSFRAKNELPDREHMPMLRLRALRKAPAASEFNSIEKRLNEMIDPVVSTLVPQVLQCADAAFWRNVEANFAECLPPRIEEEFGCIVAISDLKRDKNPFEDELDSLEDPDMKKRVLRSLDMLDQADVNYHRELSSRGFDADHPEVVKARQNAARLREELEAMKGQMNAGQLKAVRELPTREREALLDPALLKIAELLAASVPRNHARLKENREDW